MMCLLLKKQIYMEGGCMLGNIIVVLCMLGLLISVVYAVYMYQWGVWKERNDG